MVGFFGLLVGACLFGVWVFGFRLRVACYLVLVCLFDLILG